MSLLSQAQAAGDSTFRLMCEAAAAQTAHNVYTEATTLNGGLVSGTAITSIPVTPNLTAAIAAGVVVSVGGELFVATATASGASAISVNSKAPVRDHQMGEVVTPPTPTGHSTRAVLASKVLNAPDLYQNAFAWALSGLGDSSATADATILSHVSAVWNDIAQA